MERVKRFYAPVKRFFVPLKNAEYRASMYFMRYYIYAENVFINRIGLKKC